MLSLYIGGMILETKGLRGVKDGIDIDSVRRYYEGIVIR